MMRGTRVLRRLVFQSAALSRAEVLLPAIIVELKQWTEAKTTGKDAVVETFLGKARREVPHPSYQAWSYATLLQDFNEAVRDTPINLVPCAYLHNCETPETIRHEFYRAHVDRAPAFLKDDATKLRAFIRAHITPQHVQKYL